MFAGVMAYAMGVKVEHIRQGLRTFDTTYFQAPGRMNVFNDLPFKVIMDYGHNPAAVQVMSDLVQRMDVRGRRIVVLSGPGDRRDEDIRGMAVIAAKAFDHVILRRDDSLRGRGPREVPEIMHAALRAAGIPDDRSTIIPDEQEAIDHALKMAAPGNCSRATASICTKGNRNAASVTIPASAVAMPARKNVQTRRAFPSTNTPVIDEKR
jgi:cyanophycin synthetase